LTGGQHGSTLVVQKDAQRTRWLNERGVTVLRFWNSDVIQNISGVLEAISAKIDQLKASEVTPTRRWRADLLPFRGR
jgi:very-short-patch-repair endonuclease